MVTLYLARWETRFWAWLIDIILIGLPLWALSDRLPPSWRFTIEPGLVSFSLSSVVLFLYLCGARRRHVREGSLRKGGG